MFAVITNKREKSGRGNTRKILARKHPKGHTGAGTNYYTPTRDFWTDAQSDIWSMSEVQAREICGKLRHNNPRVVTSEKAKSLMANNNI